MRLSSWSVLASVCVLNSCGGGGGGNGSSAGGSAATVTCDSSGYSLSGTASVKFSPGATTTGITLWITGAPNVSAPEDLPVSGSFSLGNLQAGTYQVSLSQPGYLFDPAQISVNVQDCDAVANLSFQQTVPDDGLTSTEAAALDSLPDVPISPATTILPNGQTLLDYANAHGIPIPPGVETSLSGPSASRSVARLNSARGSTSLQDSQVPPESPVATAISQMVLSAEQYACARRLTNPCTIWNYPADPTEPATMPAQTGLTYIWGGKTPLKRTHSNPDDGCPQLTYGMDCSGLLGLVAAAAGITAPAGSTLQADPTKYSVPAGLLLKLVSDGSKQAGDILVWSNHAGIYGSDNRVISSTGDKGDCIPNITPPRGPRSLTINGLHKGPPQFVLRLSAGIVLAISPSEPTLQLNQSITLTVSATDGSGNSIATPSNLTWGSSVGTVATVVSSSPSTASVMGIGYGTSTISVSDPSSGAALSTTVTVGNPWLGSWSGTITSSCNTYSGPGDVMVTDAGSNAVSFDLNTDIGEYDWILTTSGDTGSGSLDNNTATCTVNGAVIVCISLPSCQTGIYTRQSGTAASTIKRAAKIFGRQGHIGARGTLISPQLPAVQLHR